MMAQYLEIKAGHPDALLFYRMGDFYELFFDDAVAAAAALDIALTRRGKHLGEDIAMCGVPVHSAEAYLNTLIRKGFRVAVCEQTEDPAEAKKRGSKSVVRRAVVRLVTPGTLTEDTLLEARASNYLAAVAVIREETALAWVELSTGALAVAPVAPGAIGAQMARLAPSEVLLAEPDGANDASALLVAAAEQAGAVVTPRARAAFDSQAGGERLKRLFRVASLDGFGAFSRVEIAALGALADYLELTQQGRLPMLRPPRREAVDAVMRIDAATRRNLELMRTLSGAREGSLLAAVDRTRTGAGARLLAERLSAPLIDPAAIAARHDAVDWLAARPDAAAVLDATLAETPDLERALSRLALGRGGPRDVAAVRGALQAAATLPPSLAPADPSALAPLPVEIDAALAALTGHDALRQTLEDALADSPPLALSQGGAIRAGHDGDLDRARQLSAEGRGVIAGMQRDLAQATGIDSLKIKHNNVLGYFVEVTARHAERLHENPEFRHRQTLANAHRFTTEALAETENAILNAGARAAEIEARLFAGLVEAVLAEHGALTGVAAALAMLDVALSAARLAGDGGWVRPVVDRSRSFAITGGRHPGVEAALRREGRSFVPNDADLSAGADGPAPLWLVTGPNMAGKSTFLRQNALIAILAQAGLYVPAEAAHLGVIDQVFSRVGAADDLAAGRSTFMVEMVETAAILNQAGPAALVILDEIGRGTATWDGLSIAWATLEHLHDVNRCRGLFATHYHELTALADRLPALAPVSVRVREWEGEVVFLHEIAPGAADRSYGVQVARLAGLPDAVVDRAREVLSRLEARDRDGDATGAADIGAALDGLPLFAARPTPPPPAPAADSGLIEALAALDPDALSPREALDALYRLRALLPKA
ncbi:MAG: DNA mismatch repair protein MutS [Pseudomonadota bacterium]